MSAQSQTTGSTIDAATQHPLRRHLEKFLTGLAFTLVLSLIAEGLPTKQAHGAELTAAPQNAQAVEVALASTAFTPSLQNGTHLFGQSPQANQLNSAYMVMEVNNGQVVGAFYMPQSAFDCFHGEVQAEQLALTVTDSYAQTSYPYAVALQQNATIAAINPAIASFSPAGFHTLETLSATDRQILNTCKTANRE
jgi:hypothetical protein